LLRRDTHQHGRRVVRSVRHKGAVARPHSVRHPQGIFARETSLKPRFRLGEESRVVRQLFIPVPLVKALEALPEFLLLLRFEIEVIVGGPRRDQVELGIADADHAAARKRGEQQRQQYRWRTD